MAIHHPHDLNMAASPEHTISSPPPLNPFVMRHYYLTTTSRPAIDHGVSFRTIVGFILAGWGDGPEGLFHGNCIRHQLHFMQCSIGEWVQLGSIDCIQPDHVAHVKVWAMAAHTSTHSSIFSSPPLTHTPHTHPCGWVLTLCLAVW